MHLPTAFDPNHHLKYCHTPSPFYVRVTFLNIIINFCDAEATGKKYLLSV